MGEHATHIAKNLVVGLVADMLRDLWKQHWLAEYGRPWNGAADGKLLVDGGTEGPHDIELATLNFHVSTNNDRVQHTMRLAFPDVSPPSLVQGATMSLEGKDYIITSVPTMGKFKLNRPYEGTGSPQGELVGQISGVELSAVQFTAKSNKQQVTFTLPSLPGTTPPSFVEGATILLESQTYTITGLSTVAKLNIDRPYEGTGLPKGKVEGSITGSKLDTVTFMATPNKQQVSFSTRTLPEAVPPLLVHGASIFLEGSLYTALER